MRSELVTLFHELSRVQLVKVSFSCYALMFVAIKIIKHIQV